MNESIPENDLVCIGHEVFSSLIWIKVFIACFLFGLVTLAVCGNILVILTLIRIKNFTRKINVFFTSMAVADLLIAVFVMVPSILRQLSHAWFLHDRVTTRIILLVDIMCSTSSILHFTCMTTDRFIAISKPFKYFRIMTRKVVGFLILLLWTLPFIEGYILSTFNPNDSLCLPGADFIPALVGSIVSFYIPLAFNIVLNIKIYLIVRRRRFHDLGDAQLKNMKTEFRVARTISILFGCFCASWTPFFVANIYSAIRKEDLTHLTWYIVTWIGYFNSTINPFLFYFLHKRKILRKRNTTIIHHISKEKEENIMYQSNSTISTFL
ncbi:dopamine D2-like receptor [Saccostrea cucullata]|uniref:dopamine D2-like receptor n=1 Tax=Saccostrea cuccullata TaxID=36930 RepID=UPI002ED1981B